MTAQNAANFTGNGNQGVQVAYNNGNIYYTVEANDNCLKDLRLTNPRDDKQRIKDTKGGLLEGSYEWILDHSDFQRWRNDDQSRLLWIKGDPGKGKTMLLIGIVDELDRELKKAEQSASPTVLSYFFCQGTDAKLNNAKAVLRGLIYLLAVQQPSLASNLRKEYEHSGSKLFEDTNAFVALSKILIGMLLDPSVARAYIIIDALDECEADLQKLLKLVVQNMSASRVKWIVSSRNRYDIEQQLKLDDSQTKLSLELKANADYVSRAVRMYIDDRVSQLESLQDDYARQDQVRQILRQKAADTFLWVALVVQELESVASWDVLDVLEEMPTGLEELYARMLKQIQQLKRGNPELCRLVLSTATLAYRPLHMLELGVLSGLPEKISNKMQSVRQLVSMCGSFLTVRDDRVYIIHQSAKDYLMSDMATTTIFPTGTAEVHRDISLRSIQAMLNTLRRDIYSLRHPGFSIGDLKMPASDPLASVRYSCIHWVDHLCGAPQRNDLVDGGLVHKFLEGNLLYWAEASSLLGALSDTVLAVGNLERLLKTMSSESSLLSLTVDAHRFLLHNGLIIKNAPLQTYVSALLFSPTRSLTRELFKKEKPQWVLTGPTVDQYWGPLVRTLEGHGSAVWSVAFSPDGKFIASASYDATIKVWDAATGEVKHTLAGHGTWVESVAFSPDGKLIASASGNDAIRVWDVATGEVKHTLEGHGNWVWSVAFLPDGKLIASGYNEETVRIWDAVTGEVKHTLEDHGNRVESVAFAPDGKLIASPSGVKSIKIWDAATGELKNTLAGHGNRVESVAFSPDGKLIASGSRDDTIKVWDAATDEAKHTLKGHGDRVESVAFSPDGKLIASGSSDDTIKVWDAATGEVKQTLVGHGDRVESVAFSPDGKLIASASYDTTIKVWHAATDEVKQTLEGHGRWDESVVFSPDGKLIASPSSDKTIKVWVAATGEIKHTLEGHGYRVKSVAFSPDGKLIASVSYDTIKIWDAVTGEAKQTLVGHGNWVWSVLPDWKGLASGYDEKTVKVWDAATGEVKRKRMLEDHGKGFKSVVVSPDGKLIKLRSDDDTIKVWDAATDEVQHTLEGHSIWVEFVVVSPDGKLIASAWSKDTIRVWDAITGEVKHTLEGHGNRFKSVAFSPDGKLIVSVSYDTIKIWDAVTGEVKHTLEGHGNSVTLVAFSPDGKLVASVSDDRTIKPSASYNTTIKIWDAVTGEVKQTLKCHGNKIESVAFSPDGKLVASVSYDTIKVWDAATGKFKHTLEGHGDRVKSFAFSPDGKLIASRLRDDTIKVWDAATGEVKHTLEGHGAVYSLSFDTTGLYLVTKIGRIEVDALSNIAGKGLSQSQPQEARQCGYGLNPDKSWITWNRHKVLWLPSEYRPSSRAGSATWHSVPTSTMARVAIDSTSGRVIVISFSNPPPGLPSS